MKIKRYKNVLIDTDYTVFEFKGFYSTTITITKSEITKGRIYTFTYKDLANGIQNSVSGFTLKECIDKTRVDVAHKRNPGLAKTIERLDSAKGDGDSRGRGLSGLQSAGVIMDELAMTSPMYGQIVAGLHGGKTHIIKNNS